MTTAPSLAASQSLSGEPTEKIIIPIVREESEEEDSDDEQEEEESKASDLEAQRLSEQVSMLFQFTMEKIDIELKPSPASGTTKLGFDDPQFAVDISLEQMSFTQEGRLHDSKMTAILHSLTIIDRSNARFPHAIHSGEAEPNGEKKALIQFDIYRQEKMSPRYAGVDMNVDIAFGNLVFFWHPKTINQILRFFRYNKFPEMIVQDHLKKQAARG